MGAQDVAAPSAATPAALPCLNSNNSIERKLTPSAKRTAFALTLNLCLLAKEVGIQRLGFLTLTFADHVTCVKEASRRFNSLRTNVLCRRYRAFIAVMERQKTGRIHFHLVVAIEADIRESFSFSEASNGNYSSANISLRREWAFWRATAKKYRFGRTELMPIKSTAEGISKYVGKYIAKHMESRISADKGARLVRYSNTARRATCNFAWASPRSALWRAKLKQFAESVGCYSTAMLHAKFGPKWAYNLAPIIMQEVLRVYPSLRHALADGLYLPPDMQ